MNADFLAVLEFWEREKGINRDVLVGAVQEALLSAAKKAVGPARELRVEIDQKNGDIKAFAKLIGLLLPSRSMIDTKGCVSPICQFMSQPTGGRGKDITLAVITP